MKKAINEFKAKAAFSSALEHYSQEFEHFFLAQFLGLRFAYEDGCCIVRTDVEDFMFNPQGTLHGGVIAMIMDVSMGHLLKQRFGSGATLEMKTQFLRPVPLGPIRAVGSLLKSGRTTHFLRSELFNANDELCAFATSTWIVRTTPHPDQNDA